MTKFTVGVAVGAFTLIVLGMGVLILVDKANAQPYLGAVALLAVLGTIVVFGLLLHTTSGEAADRDRRETYARVMIALVTATAGTAGGVGGGAVVGSNQNDEAEKLAAAANQKAGQAQRQVDEVEKAQPGNERPRTP